MLKRYLVFTALILLMVGFTAADILGQPDMTAKTQPADDEPLKIENIARELGMSVSGFHHHFKSVTAISPLQFQKQMRLQEARRLMLGEEMDAASAGFRVGYEDPSYFSRDYKKLFGAPPQRDIARLRSDFEV